MTVFSGTAPAKVNLTLHITGQRGDGYHLLDSLVVFADVGDRITVTAGPDLRLIVQGPFADGIPTDNRNTIVRAARALQTARGVTDGATITLEKSLPHAAGLGGGSSDAATALRLLADLWRVAPLLPGDPAVLTLGADVPVCLAGPSPHRMQGIGELVTPLPLLPSAGLILVNPRVEVATAKVFNALTSRQNPPMDALPSGLNFDDFARWLGQHRNDLHPAAAGIAPAIDTALAALRRQPGVGAAMMSGSGATCVGLVRDMGTARQIARSLQVGNMGWWVTPAALLR